jgi:hypothetical protein
MLSWIQSKPLKIIGMVGSTYKQYGDASLDSADEVVQEPKIKRTAIGDEVITDTVPSTKEDQVAP